MEVAIETNKIERTMATNMVIVYLNIDLIQYCIETYQMWKNRQTM